MVICAAMRIARPEDELGDLIICGHRHSDCREILFRLNPELSKEVRKEDMITDGFLVTGNRFLDREQAYLHAIICGQLSEQAQHDKQLRKENILYSEDLY